MQKLLWNKTREIHKDACNAQCDSNLKNRIIVRSENVPHHQPNFFSKIWYCFLCISGNYGSRNLAWTNIQKFWTNIQKFIFFFFPKSCCFYKKKIVFSCVRICYEIGPDYRILNCTSIIFIKLELHRYAPLCNSQNQCEN